MNARLMRNVCKVHHAYYITRIFWLQSKLADYATFSKNVETSRYKLPVPKQQIIVSSNLLRKLSSIRVDKTMYGKSHAVEILLENLENHFNLKGSINYDMYENLLVILEKLPVSHNAILSKKQTCFLLSVSGLFMPTQKPICRMMLFNRMWRYLVDNEQCSTDHYFTKLKVLQHNCIPLSDVQSFIRELCNLDKDVDMRELYSELLKVACYSGDMHRATEMLANMRDHNIALRERDFNALILGHARNQDIEGCQTVLESMVAAGIPFSNETHAVLTLAYLENGIFIKAKENLFKHLKDFNIDQIITILRSALSVNLETGIVKNVVLALPRDYVNGQEVPYALRNLCIELLHNNKLDCVLTIMSALPQRAYNTNQDYDTYGKFLLYELFALKTTSEKIIQVAELLKSNKTNERALHIATDMALRLCPAKALPFLEVLAKEEALRPHYFWPLVIYNYRQHGENGIFGTMELMKKFVTCDQETLTKYVLPRLTTILKNPQRLVKTLTGNGLKTSQVLLPVISHMLIKQQFEEVYILAQSYTTKLDIIQLVMPLSNVAINVRATKRYQQFTKVLASLARKTEDPKMDFIGLVLIGMVGAQSRLRDDLEALQSFINNMHKYGLTISPMAAENFEMLFQEQPKNKILAGISITLTKMCNHNLILPNIIESGSGCNGSFVKHPRNMSLDELKSHLVELESKCLNTRGVLRRLLQLCVRENRLERALEIKSKCEELNLHMSPGMLASIFDLYIKLKDLCKAQKAYEQIKTKFPGFNIDEHKIIDFAALLVQENQLETSKRLLSNWVTKQKPVGGDYVVKNAWNFLTCVANLAARTPNLTSEHNLSREAFLFLHQLGYITPQNAVLGPIVREFLIRLDIKSAVKEFLRLAEQYKCTPLQYELLSLLVRLGNADAGELKLFPVNVKEAHEMLSEVIAATTKVHGVVNMNSALVLAFAESGTDNQLRRLLIDRDFRINQELLIKNCDYLGQEGSIRTLLRLARASRGLDHVVKEQDIYNMLLSKFADSNNCEAAVHLFNHLDTDDELKISNEFLCGLVNLLNFNNIEIPSNLAVRAQVM